MSADRRWRQSRGDGWRFDRAWGLGERVLTKIVLFSLTGLVASLVPGGAAQSAFGASSAPDALVVDDDHAQCPNARFRKIQQAVDEATAGDTVQVCPGLYVEHVVVDKTLTLSGASPAVSTEACLDAEAAPVEKLDLSTYTVLRAPDLKRDVWVGDPLPGSSMTLAADNARLTGFVVTGTPEAVVLSTQPNGSTATFYPGAVTTSPDHSGYRIDHNMIRSNGLGIEARSNGQLLTQVDHNCMRDNTWALANQRSVLSNAVIAYNTTFATKNYAYEVGWVVAPMEQVVFEHNTSLRLPEKPTAYATQPAHFRIGYSTDITVSDNDLFGTYLSVYVDRANHGVRVSDNLISGDAATFRGVAVAGGSQPATTGLQIVGNTVTKIGAAPLLGVGINFGPNNRVTGAVVADNVASDNGFAGIQLQSSAVANVVEGNTATGNQIGISATIGTSGNYFTANTMSGNTALDASELGTNVWTGNVCSTDNVAGAICGSP
jgi:parallel beta-helix repeat protein